VLVQDLDGFVFGSAHFGAWASDVEHWLLSHAPHTLVCT
jgi:hypothetical protein